MSVVNKIKEAFSKKKPESDVGLPDITESDVGLPDIKEFLWETDQKVLKAAADAYGITFKEFVKKLTDEHRKKAEEANPSSPAMKAFRRNNNL